MTVEDALAIFVAEKAQKVRPRTIKEHKHIVHKYFRAAGDAETGIQTYSGLSNTHP